MTINNNLYFIFICSSIILLNNINACKIHFFDIEDSKISTIQSHATDCSLEAVCLLSVNQTSDVLEIIWSIDASHHIHNVAIEKKNKVTKKAEHTERCEVPSFKKVPTKPNYTMKVDVNCSELCSFYITIETFFQGKHITFGRDLEFKYQPVEDNGSVQLIELIDSSENKTFYWQLRHRYPKNVSIKLNDSEACSNSPQIISTDVINVYRFNCTINGDLGPGKYNFSVEVSGSKMYHIAYVSDKYAPTNITGNDRVQLIGVNVSAENITYYWKLWQSDPKNVSVKLNNLKACSNNPQIISTDGLNVYRLNCTINGDLEPGKYNFSIEVSGSKMYHIEYGNDNYVPSNITGSGKQCKDTYPEWLQAVNYLSYTLNVLFLIFFIVKLNATYYTEVTNKSV